MPSANEFLTNEEDAVENAAYAQASALEAAAAFAYVVEKLEFPKATQEAFMKNLNRCINAVASAIPNQWKQKVYDAVKEATKEVQTAEEKAAASAAHEPA